MDLVTNHQRAAWAVKALANFTAQVCFTDHPEGMHTEDLKDTISDLICDLLHFAHQQGMDAGAVMDQARSKYEAEIAEGT